MAHGGARQGVALVAHADDVARSDLECQEELVEEALEVARGAESVAACHALERFDRVHTHHGLGKGVRAIVGGVRVEERAAAPLAALQLLLGHCAHRRACARVDGADEAVGDELVDIGLAEIAGGHFDVWEFVVRGCSKPLAHCCDLACRSVVGTELVDEVLEERVDVARIDGGGVERGVAGRRRRPRGGGRGARVVARVVEEQVLVTLSAQRCWVSRSTLSLSCALFSPKLR